MLKRLVKLITVEYFIPSVFIPLLLLAAYCGVFGKLLLHYQLLGVNYLFLYQLQRLSIYGLVLFGIIYIPLFILKKLRDRKEFSFTKFNKDVSITDAILLLFPLTVVVQYIINNFEILSRYESLLVVIFFLLFSIFTIFIIPRVLAIVGSFRILISLSMAFVFTIVIMPSLSEKFNWFWEGDFKIQFLVFLCMFIIVSVFYVKPIKKLLYIFILINFVVSISFELLQKDAEMSLSQEETNYQDNELLIAVNGKVPQMTPNIFFLVYEAYVPNETMQFYGINNEAQEEFLKDMGFKLYPGVYSVGSPTLNSLSRVFNASSEYFGNQRRGIAGDGVVQNLLSDFGYKTYGIVATSWIFRGFGTRYDFSYPEPKDNNLASHELLISAILIGEFRSDIIFDELDYGQFIKEKRGVFEDDLPQNGFYYIHSGLPGHSQDSGVCLEDEIEQYKIGVQYANNEMQDDIKSVVLNHPEAIIIIAGDHGPYLTKNCIGTSEDYDISEITRLDIQDRFATFLAIKWPKRDYQKIDDIVVLQDIFPVILAYMFDDIRILESKIEPNLVDSYQISGATVKNGMIYGGINDGEPLFLSNQ